MADHRLRHRCDGIRQRLERAIPADPDLLVIGAEGSRDDVRVAELVTAMLVHRIEANRESADILVSQLGQQGDQQG